MLRDDVGHRHRLAGAGHAEQRLEAVAALEPCRQLGDRLGLIARGLERSLEVEFARAMVGQSNAIGVCSGGRGYGGA